MRIHLDTYQQYFLTAEAAFEYYFQSIMDYGVDFDGTKTLFNVGFTIENPKNNLIETPWRKWSKEYADFEWEWYLSKNPNAFEISERAKIWRRCMDEQGNVNSNYGYQWSRGQQLEKVIDMLRKNPNTRKASISLYDGKEIDLYKNDTICTYAISFYIYHSKLNMTVMMRSNDLVYGFCNDQYCFSKLQEMVSKETGYAVGEYHHFVNNLHIYERHFNLREKFFNSKQ